MMKTQIVSTVSEAIFRFAEIGLTADQALEAGVFNKLGTGYKVKYNETIKVGYGFGLTYEDAQGRILANFRDESDNLIAGQLKVSVEDEYGNVLIQNVAERPTEVASASPTDRSKQEPFPDTTYGGAFERIIVVRFKPDATATLNLANSDLKMSMTRTLI